MPRWRRELRLALVLAESALVRDGLTRRQEELRQTRHDRAVALQIHAIVGL